MKDFLKTTLIVAVLLTIGLYVYHTKIAPVPMIGAVADTALEKIGAIPAASHETSPDRELTDFLDLHVDKVFSPLSHQIMAVPPNELRMLREQFETRLQGHEGSREANLCALRLCDTLMKAIATREQHMLRLTRAGSMRNSGMAIDPEREIERRRELFSAAVNRSWLQASHTLKAAIDRDYLLLQRLEMSRGDAPAVAQQLSHEVQTQQPTVVATSHYEEMQTTSTGSDRRAVSVRADGPRSDDPTGRTETLQVSLASGWSSPSSGGIATMREFATLFSENAAASSETTGSQSPIYRGVHYLMPMAEAAEVLGLRKPSGSATLIASPGFPRDSLKYYSFRGDFENFYNKLHLVVDLQDRVVSVQLVAENPQRRRDVRPVKVESAPSAHEGREASGRQPVRYVSADAKWNTYSFIDNITRRRDSQLILHQVSRISDEVFQLESEIWDSSSMGYKRDWRNNGVIRWYAPKPLVALILYRIQESQAHAPEVTLASGWDRPMTGGTATMRDLSMLFSEKVTASSETRADSFPIYRGVHYLMPVTDALKALGITSRSIATTELACPGFPLSSFRFYTYNGFFEDFYTKLYLVVDRADRVVSVQLVAENPRRSREYRPTGIESEGMPPYFTSTHRDWHTYNFINSRTKALNSLVILHQVSQVHDQLLQLDSELWQPHARGYQTTWTNKEMVRWYAPKPLLALVLYCIQMSGSR